MRKRLTFTEYQDLCSYLQAICERIGGCSNSCPAEDKNGNCVISHIKGLLLRYAVKKG